MKTITFCTIATILSAASTLVGAKPIFHGGGQPSYPNAKTASTSCFQPNPNFNSTEAQDSLATEAHPDTNFLASNADFNTTKVPDDKFTSASQGKPYSNQMDEAMYSSENHTQTTSSDGKNSTYSTLASSFVSGNGTTGRGGSFKWTAIKSSPLKKRFFDFCSSASVHPNLSSPPYPRMKETNSAWGAGSPTATSGSFKAGFPSQHQSSSPTSTSTGF